MKKAVIFDQYSGGLSTDDKLGIANSFAYSKHVDFRKKPSQMSALPATRRVGSQNIVDLIQNSVMTDDGSIYFLGHNGWLYKRHTDGTFTPAAEVDNGAYGLSYRSDVDAIYIASTTTVSEYSPISNNPTIKLNKFKESVSTDSDASQTGSSNTTTVQTALSESVRRSYEPDIEPVSAIKIYIADKGTGDWTLTLHDPANNVLGTKTIANADLTDGVANTFTFTTPVRQYVSPNARTYHYHLTSTVADGTISSEDADDASTGDFQIVADRLIATKNGMHPIQTFIQYECIGNGRYLSAWEPLSEEPTNSEWKRHKITFPSGLEVCGLAVWNEYLAIACEHRTSGSNEPQDGYIFLWDGISTTYNTYFRVPEGSPYSLHEYKNVLYYYAGGSWFAWAGESSQKIRTMPNTDSEFSDAVDQTIIYPYMATVRRGIHLMGFPSETTNLSAEHGVYSYGSVDKNFPDSFGYSYTISTGTILNSGTNNLKIGHIKSYGDKLFISWQDDDATGDYGLDVVDNSSDPFATAEWRSIFFDDGIATKEKTPVYAEAIFPALPAGATVTLKYRTSPSEAWTYSDTADEGDTSLRLNVHKRFNNIQFGIDFTATTITWEFDSLTFVFDSNVAEKLA